MARYVALLRGINVGGKNAIPMPALKACFEDAGFEDVGTYIQSGNVVFSGPSSSQAALTRRVERTIRKAFAHYDASVVVRSRSQMRAIVDKSPKGFGREPAKYRYDVCFLKPSLTAKQVVAPSRRRRAWTASGPAPASSTSRGSRAGRPRAA